jgi:hypothetical protein
MSLLDSFSTEETRDTIDKARKVLFVKKVLLGGENEILTHQELEKLILNFDHLLLIGLDIVRYKHIILNQESILQLVKRDVNDLFDMVTQGTLGNRDGELMFTMKEAFDAAKIFIKKSDFDIEKFENLIGEVKTMLMKGSSEEVRGGEMKTLFNHAKKVLQTGTVFHRIYDKFRVALDKPNPVEETINFDEYRYTYPEHQAELDLFERIAKKYRFMKGENYSSYYTRGFKRNADAMFEIYLLEYAIKIVFEKYGARSPNADAVGGYSIDKEQMRKLVVHFEKELVEIGLILPGKAISTADNISLLGTLFQYQSDKNKVMDVNEATEFGETLLSSINLADDIFQYMEDQKCVKDEFDRFDGNCIRKNYWKAFCIGYKQYFPLMFDSFGVTKCEDMKDSSEMQTVLAKSIGAARTCNYYTDGNKEEIPYSKGDLMTILIAMMHAETTILRWDVVTKNNYMDADEVMNAYDIYSPALDGFLEGKNAIIKKFKKQIYQYMIKYEQIPDEKDFGSIWKFIKFLLSFDKKAPAYRRTIVSLLNVIGEQNKKLPDAPAPFNCNLLRNPETIPPTDYADFLGKQKPIVKLSSEEIKSLLAPVAQYLDANWQGDVESLRQDLVALSEEMVSEELTRIKDIRTKNVRNLFTKISDNKALMGNINIAFNEGPEVQRIALALTMILTQN